VSEGFLSGGRQMTGCAGYSPGRGAKLILDRIWGRGQFLRGAWRLQLGRVGVNFGASGLSDFWGL
jgi:hypothetical protein